MRHTLTALGFAAILCGVLTGCTTSGVGDPCSPERVPDDGFGREELFIETNSVQCRTRVCLVYRLRGDPRHVLTEDSCPCADGVTIPTVTDAGPSCALLYDDCVLPQEIEDRIMCSCRCALLPGVTSSLPLCDCPSGFSCSAERGKGDDGDEGKYCIPDNVAGTAR
jgi:hypothetical protein